MQFSENISKLKPSATMAVSSLAKRLASEGRDILNLSAGEPDFDTPEFIREAGIEGIRGGGTRYTPPAGMPDLRKAIAASLQESTDRHIDWEGVVVTAGAKQALFNAAFTLFGPGDEVLIVEPYWTTYPAQVELARAEPVVVRGQEATDFKINPSDLEAVTNDRTRGLILNTPSNPTGAVYSMSELQAIAEWARDRDVCLVSDEIYRSIYYGDEGKTAPGILDLPESSLGPYVLIDGASKCWAMTGWRIGFSYADPDLSKKFTALQSQITSNPATPSQLAALEAFSDIEGSKSAVDHMNTAFRRRRNLVTTQIENLLPGVPYVQPEGAFYLYFRVDGFFNHEVQNATQWCSHILEDQGVALVPGAAFGNDNWVRMSFASSDEVLEDAFSRLAAGAGVGTAT